MLDLCEIIIWPTPSKRVFIPALSRIFCTLLWGEFLVPGNPPDASRVCARRKGCGLTIQLYKENRATATRELHACIEFEPEPAH